jgi:hypothetical protein
MRQSYRGRPGKSSENGVFDAPDNIRIILYLGIYSLLHFLWTFGENRANHRPISSKDVTAYEPMG